MRAENTGACAGASEQVRGCCGRRRTGNGGIVSRMTRCDGGGGVALRRAGAPYAGSLGADALFPEGGWFTGDGGQMRRRA
jgi:hypothetical protein